MTTTLGSKLCTCMQLAWKHGSTAQIPLADEVDSSKLCARRNTVQSCSNEVRLSQLCGESKSKSRAQLIGKSEICGSLVAPFWVCLPRREALWLCEVRRSKRTLGLMQAFLQIAWVFPSFHFSSSLLRMHHACRNHRAESLRALPLWHHVLTAAGRLLSASVPPISGIMQTEMLVPETSSGHTAAASKLTSHD